jgi:ornithine decarboxylase
MTPCVDFKILEEKKSHQGMDIDRLRDIFEDKSLVTPMLTLSRSGISRNYNRLNNALPRVNIHYAIKPNNHSLFIEEIHKAGGNFDVCSVGEIDLVSSTKIDPKTLIHSHPIKSIEEFDYAVGEGLEVFVVDNIDEVHKLSRYTHKRLKIMTRFRCHINNTAVVNLQYKFGCVDSDVLPLANAIREAGHDFYGLCFHIGSQCIHSENYVTAIEVAHTLINELDLAGFNPRMLDIGGGFPVEYIEPVPEIEEFCHPINEALDKHIRPGIKVVCEPGRYIAATPATLITTVIGKAFRDGKIWYYLDDGLYSTFSGIVFDHCQYSVISNQQGENRLSVLAGPTCDSFDVMYDGILLPEHHIGDRIAFVSIGAYCSVSGSNFNSMRRPEYLVVD